MICDFSHRYKNLFSDTVKDMRLMSLWLLMVVTMNAEHGPQSEEARHTQLSESLIECLDNYTPKTCALSRSTAATS